MADRSETDQEKRTITDKQDSDKKKKERQKKENEESSSESLFSMEQVKLDARRAAIGGALAALFTLLGAWLVGEAAGGEAHMLLAMALETTRTFCGTVTLAMGNILALMLALLGLSAGATVDLKWNHYQRVKQIAWVDSITLIAAILIYLLLNIPLEKSENASNQSFAYFYYIILAFSSLLGGALISVILMLYNAVKDIIHVVAPVELDDNLHSDLIHTDTDETRTE